MRCTSRAPRFFAACVALAIAFTTARTLAQPPAQLRLPDRDNNAPGGTAVMREVENLDLEAREARLLAEIAQGNVPSWWKQLVPVDVTREIDGLQHIATFHVTPDYLAVGSDTDFFRVPLTPQTAQRIADLADASLPTPRMVDAIWKAARIRLRPEPIPPSPEMTTVPVFRDHNSKVHRQRALHDVAPGALVAGHKKDVVITARLADQPGRVAIYGWHKLDGDPIQPLYTGHTDRWVDYSHGIRLVARRVQVDGQEQDLPDILQNSKLASLVTDEPFIATPRYEMPGGDGTLADDEPVKNAGRGHR